MNDISDLKNKKNLLNKLQFDETAVLAEKLSKTFYDSNLCV